jgi:OHCU decarboxylase
MIQIPLTLAEVNDLDQRTFVEKLGFLFEGSPWIADEAWHARPFHSLDELHEALCRVMYEAPVERQLALIRAHPDLVGRAALAGTLTPESIREQASAGLDRLSTDEIAAFTRLNQAYHDRFDFPFVICVRENKKAGILAGFNARLGNSRAEEMTTALGEIAKIARLRLLDVIRMKDEG